MIRYPDRLPRAIADHTSCLTDMQPVIMGTTICPWLGIAAIRLMASPMF